MTIVSESVKLDRLNPGCFARFSFSQRLRILAPNGACGFAGLALAMAALAAMIAAVRHERTFKD